MRIADSLAFVERRIAQIAGIDATPTFAAVLTSKERRDAGSASDFDAIISERSARWGVDPNLVKAIVANESGFDPLATSKSGAQGLMQIMPTTAASMGITQPYDAIQNIDGGTRYLRGLLDRFHGNVRLAVAAYNAGPNVVARYGDVPPYSETQAYVAGVLASYAKYCRGKYSGNASIT